MSMTTAPPMATTTATAAPVDHHARFGGGHHDGYPTHAPNTVDSNNTAYSGNQWNAGLQEHRLAPSIHRPFRNFGNPSPLGLSALALTLFVWSLINAQARSVINPNIVVGLAFFYGGLVQFAAGMWEFAVGNTFGATALASFGGFWLSYGLLQIPGSQIVQSYSADGSSDLRSAMGFYLIGWFIFTFLLWLGTFRTTAAFVFSFGCFWISFLLLAINQFTQNNSSQRAGGIFGILAAFGFWYSAFAGLLTKEHSGFNIPVFPLNRTRANNVNNKTTGVQRV